MVDTTQMDSDERTLFIHWKRSVRLKVADHQNFLLYNRDEGKKKVSVILILHLRFYLEKVAFIQNYRSFDEERFV